MVSYSRPETPDFDACATVKNNGFCIAYFQDASEAMRYMLWLRQVRHKCANGAEPDMLPGLKKNLEPYGWVTGVTY